MNNSERKLVINGVYRHFKGGIYNVLDIGYDSETHYPVVIYKCVIAAPGHEQNQGKTWVRDLNMFLSEVDHEKYPEVTQKFRFELMGDDSNE